MPGCPAKPTVTSTVQLSATQVVAAGQIFDGAGRRFNLSGGSQSEGQPPVFLLENGATLRNVVIGNLAADGVHCNGSCLIENVWWEDIGEDAATAKGPAGTTMRINCGAAFAGDDKTFQHNGRGAVHITNFKAFTAGKLYRSCGDCTGNGGPRYVTIENVRTNDVPTIAGINKNFGDVARIRNITVNGGSTKIKVCQVYQGVVKGEGSTSALGVEFGTANCDVLPSDVTLVNSTQLNTTGYTGTSQPKVMTE
jgi:pectate lyase